jgi:Fic-DOC domain mobile mystery protein B
MKKDNTQIQGATPIDDVSGLLLNTSRHYTLDDIYVFEAKNTHKVTLKYLLGTPHKKQAPFSYEWMLKLHHEMFGEVWDWAGKLRQVELSIGVKAYMVSSELKKLVDDLAFWEEHNSFSVTEIAARLHHRAVQIHPFKNGNGRWSRMLANIYLKQNSLEAITWSEGELAKENPYRDNYIQALKEADNGDYARLLELHSNTLN